MSNGFITNDQITAKSEYNSDSVSYTARLKLTGVSWCSARATSGVVDYSQYVQVDFRSVLILTGVATQGDATWSTSYVKAYYLEVSIEGNQYSDVKGSDGNRQVCASLRHCS